MSDLPKHLQLFKENAEKLLLELEKRRERVVIPLLYSMNRLISRHDVHELYDLLLSIGKQRKIDVILFSRGGDPDQAYIMGSMLQEFAEEKLTIIIPRFAKSAAMLIACAGDEIVIGPASDLGPIDLFIELNGKSVSIMSVMELISMLSDEKFSKITPMLFKELSIFELGYYCRLSRHTPHLLERLLSRRMFKNNPEMASKIANELCMSYELHSAAITLADLRGKLNLATIDPECWKIIWNLHKLWVRYVIIPEDSYPKGVTCQNINFRLGNGLVFCTKLAKE